MVNRKHLKAQNVKKGWENEVAFCVMLLPNPLAINNVKRFGNDTIREAFFYQDTEEKTKMSCLTGISLNNESKNNYRVIQVTVKVSKFQNLIATLCFFIAALFLS